MANCIKFSEIEPKLSLNTLNAIDSFGFRLMTPVQAATIPLFLTNKDVCVEATTGSGKTLSFGVPVFEMLSKRSQPLKKYELGALVIAPTRELANQIYSVFIKLSSFHKNIRCVLFVGGTDVDTCQEDFIENGAEIIIGTPGRIMDILNRCEKIIKYKEFEVLILDEADTLLDMGFKEKINQILSLLPKQRRTGLFSATQTKEVKELARAGMRNPVTVTVKVKSLNLTNPLIKNNQSSNQTTPSTLNNLFLICEYDARPAKLALFLMKHQEDKVIVFCSTCACVDYYSLVFDQMTKVNKNDVNNTNTLPKTLNVLGLHGKMVPKKRSGVYNKFVALECGVLFCTDVAARGVDIPDVDWIIQLAAPKDPSFFVHRVGRTARAGRKGGAVLFVTEEERTYIEFLKGRGVPMNEMTSIEENEENKENKDDNILITSLLWIDTIHNAMKQCACTDRGVLEAGSTAFMSFLRAYKEHICSYIFRFDQLDIGAVAKSYALLRLPKIPETRGVRGRAIVFESTDVNTSAIPYKHKEKEQARLRRLQTLIDDKAKEEEQAIIDNKNPNSNNKDKKKLEEKKEWIPAEEYIVPEDEARKRKKKQSHEQKIMDEWSEMAAEEAAYKKFKKGKLTKEEYHACLFHEEAPEMDEDGDILVSGKNGPTASVLKKKNKQEGDDDDSDSDINSDDSDNEGETNKKMKGGAKKQPKNKNAKPIPKVLHPVLSMMHGMHGKKKGKHLTFSRGGSSGSGVKKRGK